MLKRKTAPGNQSLTRGICVIEALSDYPNGCPLATLSEKCGYNKSTVHRLLQGLQSLGYVTQTLTSNYRLTARFVSIGQKVLTGMNIIPVAAGHLSNLNIVTGETVNMSFREEDHCTLIYKLEPIASTVRTRAYIGKRTDLYCSAMGKVYLAYEPGDYLGNYWAANSQIVAKLTPTTITDLEDMRREVAEIRKNGFALDNEENELGVSCLAAPIFDMLGRVCYAVSVSMVTARLRHMGQHVVASALKKTVAAISAEVGCTDYDKALATVAARG